MGTFIFLDTIEPKSKVNICDFHQIKIHVLHCIYKQCINPFTELKLPINQASTQVPTQLRNYQKKKYFICKGSY